MKKVFAAINMFVFDVEDIKGTDGWIFYVVSGIGISIAVLSNGYVILEKLS